VGENRRRLRSLDGLVGLLLTGSRGGYVSMGAGLLTFMILSAITILRTRQERPWVPLGLGMASLLIVAAGMGTFISRHYVLQSRASRLAGHGDPRPYLWQAALRQFRLEPALGTGSGTYLYYGRKFRSSEVKADPEYAHSDYLQFLAEFGVVGAALFMLVFVTHVWSGARFLQGAVRERQGSLGRLPSDSMAMGIGALSVFAACATHAVFDFNMHIPANALLTAFVLGLLASPGIDQPHPEYQFPTVTRWIRWVMPVLGAWILVQGVSTWPAEYFGEQARMALRDDRYAEAVALARKALRYDSRNPYLSLYLGQANLALAEAHFRARRGPT
jgi:O-antigen ligase